MARRPDPACFIQRLSRELPGTDRVGHPLDPVRYIQLKLIPALARHRGIAVDSVVRKADHAVGLLLRALWGYMRADDQKEADRLIADTQCAVLRISHRRLRNACCEAIKGTVIKSGPRSARWKGLREWGELQRTKRP